MKKKIIILSILAIVIIIGISSGRILVGKSYREFKEFQKVYGKYYQIQEILEKEALGYNEASSDTNIIKLNDNVYRKLLKSMDDPYADYYTTDEFKSFERMFAESYDGIGIEIGDVKFKNQDEILVLVFGVMDDSPAKKAGIKPGDIITKVDGNKVKNSDETCEKVLGIPGTPVKVTVERKDEEITYNMNRARIEEKPVKYKELDKKNKIAYIYVSTFKEGTSESFKLAVKDLKNKGFDKFVIDLRNNGGGMTFEAYDMADFLLPEGIIVTEKNKKGKEYTHKSDSSSANIDYVMLVNAQTASASEIIACAVQDNKGGKIIGTKTYGKGVTQKTYRLYDGSALKYTVQEYFRPSGKSVNHIGIVPDIKVKNPNNDKEIFEIAKKTLLK